MTDPHIPAGLTGPQRDAFVSVQSLLDSWGLGSLAKVLTNYVKDGYSNTSITYLLQQTDAYKQRFAANDIRVKNGLPPLTPAAYLQTEGQYRQVLQDAGLPKGFYDQPQDYTNWIAKDVSPAEVQRRASAAAQVVNQTDPNYRKYLYSNFGLDASHLVAHFLDPKVAEPILQKQVDAAAVGSAALDHGLQAPTANRAEQFGDMGVTAAQAQQGYSNISALLPTEQNLAHRFGGSYSQTDAENEVFTGSASAARKRRLLNEQEGALFSADSAVQHGANGTGSLSLPGAGSY